MALTISPRLKKERDDALRSMDIGRVRRVMAEMGMPDEPNDRVITIMMHKCRVASPALSEGERLFSGKWLREHGYAVRISAAGRQ